MEKEQPSPKATQGATEATIYWIKQSVLFNHCLDNIFFHLIFLLQKESSMK